MKTLLCGVFGLVLVANAPLPPPHAAVAPTTTNLPSRSDTENYIRQSTEQWAASDTEAMATFLADDYQGVSSSGEVRNKARQMELAAGPSPYTGSSIDYVNLRHLGSTVIAQGAETHRRRDSGPELRLIWTDIWMFHDGRWQVVASQDTVRPPAR